ncbi:DUF4236 domain-containing protein [Enterobacter cloacae]|uniref:DUF4236 domain-containing protein n=1 Tax=Enterobacter cloacae TaxID=550 RepID=UPI003905F1B6
MGFYVKKSIRVGPMRFNLSKSGVGASIGIKGLRIGTGPRGNYIHIGALLMEWSPPISCATVGR